MKGLTSITIISNESKPFLIAAYVRDNKLINNDPLP